MSSCLSTQYFSQVENGLDSHIFSTSVTDTFVFCGLEAVAEFWGA